MPSAESLEVGEGVVVTSFDVIDLVRSLTASDALAIEGLALVPITAQYSQAYTLPVMR